METVIATSYPIAIKLITQSLHKTQSQALLECVPKNVLRRSWARGSLALGPDHWEAMRGGALLCSILHIAKDRYI